MKQIVFFLLGVLIVSSVAAQDVKSFSAYNPLEDANKALKAACKTAKREHNNVLVQVGGNWCIWCARFDAFTKSDPSIDSLLKSSFIVYHLNYSKENKNLKTLAKYSYPQRFGFPVFLVLDGKGNLLHTQNSAYLEEGKGYSKEKIMDFLSNWTVDALNPGKYKEEK